MDEAPGSFSCSVIIPVFNRSDLLRQVLESLTKQDLPLSAFEVLVCDDGSTEPLRPVIEEFASRLPCIRHLRQSNQGPAAARNLGIVNASADVVVFIDSDVIVDGSALSKLIGALEINSRWVGAEARLQPIGGTNALGWDAPRSDNGGHFHTAGIVIVAES